MLATEPVPGVPTALKKESSSSSVLEMSGEAGPTSAAPEPVSTSLGASPPRDPAPHAAPGNEGSMGGSPTSTQQPGDSDADESLAQLRALGRQLLQGWAEALAALAKLPGVGGMRVDTLATRLGELSREASPTAAAAALAADNGSGRAAAADSSAAPQAGSRSAPPGPPPPPSSELAGPNSGQRQAYSDPVDMFATAAKSAHLSYPELLHAFAASAEGLDDEALADYLFNLAMLCAEPPENELVVRPVLSLPQNSEEQQQYRRRQAASSSAPVDAMLAAMQQQQGGGGGGLPSQAGLTQEAVWQQIMAQQQQQQGHGGGYGSGGGGRMSRGGSGLHHQPPMARSKSDMVSQYHHHQHALGDAQGLQALFRGGSASQQQFQSHLPSYGSGMGGGMQSPSRGGGLQGSGSPLAKAVSAPERDLWMAAASLAAEAEAKQQEAAAAAAAAAAASAEFSFHVQQPASPTFGRMGPLAHSGGSGLWSNSAGGSANSLGRAGGGASTGSSASGLRPLSDFSY